MFYILYLPLSNFWLIICLLVLSTVNMKQQLMLSRPWVKHLNPITFHGWLRFYTSNVEQSNRQPEPGSLCSGFVRVPEFFSTTQCQAVFTVFSYFSL